ncbi:hypothetical protein HYH03_003892 [Edaphochlamys debaryana]|uniref:Peptide-methionine (R)-S-oxide reductase n=1 Tax=Edaphochlamys debaryana TaxID=47281 RepID=A0A835YAI0_9CHLO|nr:hypothetical protein HYH03_003892 [Edaphochlamys debaryana]|eukprot:KAG2498134.1 hypothetical protein HYH03_003892 [Edaphochlamys debaryana]
MLAHRTSTALRRAPASQAAPARPARQLRLQTRANFVKWLFNGRHSKHWEPREGSTPRKISRSGYDVTPLTKEERDERAAALTPFEQYVVLQAGTERPWTGQTTNGFSHDNKRRGVYVSAVGGLPLFSSATKFESGSGWPSFYAPIDPEHVIEILDTSIPFMPRMEVVDARSGAHLGHVFNDGPSPTFKRYCINAAALKFVPEDEELPAESKPVSDN